MVFFSQYWNTGAPGNSDRFRALGVGPKLTAAAGYIDDTQDRDCCLRLVHVALTRRSIAQVQCLNRPVRVGDYRGYVVPALGCYDQVGCVAARGFKRTADQVA